METGSSADDDGGAAVCIFRACAGSQPDLRHLHAAPEAEAHPGAEKEPEATEQPAEAPKPTEEPQVTEAPAAETTEEPAEEIKWVVGEKGNIVLDASGNPIPANTIPEGAQKLATLVDKISPDRTIDIYAVHEGKYLTYGDEVTLGRKRPWKSVRTAARRRCWTRVSTRFARMTRRRERWSCRPMRTIAAIMRDSAR